MIYNIGSMTAWDRKSAINVYKLHIAEYKNTMSMDALNDVVESEKVLSEVFGVTEDEMTRLKSE